eukprot:1196390-Prorocentrum_minimum.AAC.8
MHEHIRTICICEQSTGSLRLCPLPSRNWSGAGGAGVCKETDPIKTKCWHGALLTEKDIAENHISRRDPEKPIDPARPHLEVSIRPSPSSKEPLYRSALFSASTCWVEDGTRRTKANVAPQITFEGRSKVTFFPSRMLAELTIFAHPLAADLWHSHLGKLGPQAPAALTGGNMPDTRPPIRAG